MANITAHVGIGAQKILWERFNQLTQNMAAASKNAFKFTTTHFVTRSLQDPHGNTIYYAIPGKTTVNMKDGDFIETGNPIHLAIRDAPAFFVLDKKSFSRDGAFTLNSSGQLVTMTGVPVMSKNNQPITISGKIIEIRSDGTIVADGTPGDQIQLVEFEDPSQLRLNDVGNYTTDQTPKPSKDGRVQSGGLEESNVNPLLMLTELQTIQQESIQLSRHHAELSKQNNDTRGNLLPSLKA